MQKNIAPFWRIEPNGLHGGIKWSLPVFHLEHGQFYSKIPKAATTNEPNEAQSLASKGLGSSTEVQASLIEPDGFLVSSSSLKVRAPLAEPNLLLVSLVLRKGG